MGVQWSSNDCVSTVIMPKLSTVDRGKAIGRVEAGESYRSVAQVMGVNHKTISKLMNKYQQTGDVKDLPRLGLRKA